MKTATLRYPIVISNKCQWKTCFFHQGKLRKTFCVDCFSAARASESDGEFRPFTPFARGIGKLFLWHLCVEIKESLSLSLFVGRWSPPPRAPTGAVAASAAAAATAAATAAEGVAEGSEAAGAAAEEEEDGDGGGRGHQGGGGGGRRRGHHAATRRVPRGGGGGGGGGPVERVEPVSPGARAAQAVPLLFGVVPEGLK